MPSKPRVLFVDDEERIVTLLRLMFRGTYGVTHRHLGGRGTGDRARTTGPCHRERPAHAGILVLEDCAADREQIGPALGRDDRVYPASSLAQALYVLEQHDVGVVVCEARIYRFATKPIRHAVLQLAVSAAMKEHQRCRGDIRRAAYQRTAQQAQLAPSVASGFLDGLKALTERWRLFSV